MFTRNAVSIRPLCAAVLTICTTCLTLVSVARSAPRRTSVHPFPEPCRRRNIKVLLPRARRGGLLPFCGAACRGGRRPVSGLAPCRRPVKVLVKKASHRPTYSSVISCAPAAMATRQIRASRSSTRGLTFCTRETPSSRSSSCAYRATDFSTNSTSGFW